MRKTTGNDTKRYKQLFAPTKRKLPELLRLKPKYDVEIA